MSALTSCSNGRVCGPHHQKSHLLHRRVPDTQSSRPRTPLRTAVRTGATKDDLLFELVQTLGKMGSEKIQKDFNELVVEPFSDPDPKPISGLLPPRELADDDSEFITVRVRDEEVTLHYKEVVPPPPSPPPTTTSTTTTAAAAATTTRDVDFGGGIDALLCLHGANG